MAYSLIIDIGNSATNIALFKYSRVVATRVIRNTGDPDFSLYIHEMKAFQEENHIDPKEVEGGLLSSVVPFLTRPLQIAVNSVFGFEIPVYNNTYKTNFESDIDNPDELGGDLAADIAYAKEILSDSTIVFDLGTVTKYLVLDKNGRFIGCGFAPGLESTINGFHNKTALLPEVENFELEKVVLIGKNTAQAMTNGIYYMTVEGILGICKRVEAELGYHLKKVLTGGNSVHFKEELSSFFYDQNFTLKGINFIYDLNRE